MKSTEGEQRCTILLVEDNLAIAKTLSRLLRRDGHMVDTAANGKLALVQIQVRPYDLILSDLRMPDLDGPGLYRALEQHAPHLCRRFICFTGDVLSPDIVTFLAQSGVPRLTKPFTTAAIRHAIAQALRAE
jgi:CheY-like chemotaxis protein